MQCEALLVKHLAGRHSTWYCLSPPPPKARDAFDSKAFATERASASKTATALLAQHMLTWQSNVQQRVVAANRTHHPLWWKGLKGVHAFA